MYRTLNSHQKFSDDLFSDRDLNSQSHSENSPKINLKPCIQHPAKNTKYSKQLESQAHSSPLSFSQNKTSPLNVNSRLFKGSISSTNMSKTAFMGSSSRFIEQYKVYVGPGSYQLPQIFHSSQIHKASPINSPPKKMSHQASLTPLKSGKLTIGTPGPNYYYLQRQKKLCFKEKFKQKNQEKKQKLLQLRLLMRSPQQEKKYSSLQKSQLKPLDQNNCEKLLKRSQTNFAEINKETNYKLRTKKYLVSKDNNWGENKTYQEMGNKNWVSYDPIFLSKNEKLYSAYLPKQNQFPGPGYYEKRTRKLPPKQKASEVRDFFR